MNLDWKVIALFLVGLLLWWFFFLSISHAAKQQRMAVPVLNSWPSSLASCRSPASAGGICAIVAQRQIKNRA
jgi:hypothetical protein